MAWRLSKDGASTSAIGLSVAAATFAIAFVAADLMVAKPGGEDRTTATLDTTASTALDVIVDQAGRASSGADWTTDPDAIARFGLSESTESNFLDYSKIKAMRNASMTSSADGAPDYPDVKNALGLNSGDFHIRTYPVLPAYDDPRWTKDTRGRLAYIAHVDSATGYETVTSWANTSGNYLNVSMAIRNDGTATMIFLANVGLGNMGSGSVITTEQRHTRLLSPGEVQTVTVAFPKMAFSPAVTGVKLQVSDGYGNVLYGPSWTAATSPGGTSVTWSPLLSAGATYYTSGTKVKFQGDQYNGSGSRTNSAQDARFVLVGPDGHEWTNTTVSLLKNKPYTYTCNNCTTVGNYTATLWDSGVTRKATDVVHVSAAKMFTEHETLSAGAMKEMTLLAGLVSNFNEATFDNTTAPDGDVFTDASHIFDLSEHIDRYSVLVVGSNVKQNAMNDGDTKWGIADWVQAGGNLVVFGTSDAHSNWLEPVYHAAQTTANGGISAPDVTHPMLKTPNTLDYQRYLDDQHAWSIQTDEPFTHVLTRGVNGQDQDDTIAVADPGAYNNGTVVLTSYMPYALTSPQDDAEASRLMHNMLSQSYTMLYMDYGPPVPSGTNVGSAERLVAIPHPSVPGAVVETRIVMYTWSD